MSDKRRPWLKFFPSDWQADAALGQCSLGARGLWMELISLMHKSDRYGFLLISGKKPSLKALAFLCRSERRHVEKYLQELRDFDVFSETEDGIIYSRRMVTDYDKHLTDIENGKEGGSPLLVKRRREGVNPSHKAKHKAPDKAHIPEARIEDIEEEKKDTSLRSVSQEKTKRASRISPDWKPSPAEIAYAEAQGLDAAKVAEKFLNYWLSAAKGAKADWSATWRNWCLTAAERGECLRPGHPRPSQARPERPDALASLMAYGEKSRVDSASKTHNDVSPVIDGNAEEVEELVQDH